MPILPRMPTVERVVVIGELPSGVEIPGAIGYESLLETAESFAWPAQEAAAGVLRMSARPTAA